MQILKRLGYPNTDIANDGVEAVEMTAAKTYDVVLMDMMMPRKDGLQSTTEYFHSPSPFTLESEKEKRNWECQDCSFAVS